MHKFSHTPKCAYAQKPTFARLPGGCRSEDFTTIMYKRRTRCHALRVVLRVVPLIIARRHMQATHKQQFMPSFHPHLQYAVYTYTYTFTQTHTHLHIHTCTNTHTHINIRTHTYIHTHIHTHTHTQTNTHTHIQAHAPQNQAASAPAPPGAKGRTQM